MPRNVLIIEESASVSQSYVQRLQEYEFHVDVTDSVPNAAALFAETGHGVVILDLLLSKGDPQRFLSGVLAAMPHTQVIVITASGSMRQAALAMERGAFDFLVRPFDGAKLKCVVENAKRQYEAEESSDSECETYEMPIILPESVHPKIYKIAPSSADVLIVGAGAPGRLCAAQALHGMSHWAHRPFEHIHCQDFSGRSIYSFLPKNVLEEGGTLFLDAVCQLDFDRQKELLRLLQTSSVQCSGAADQTVDIRLICGVNSNPEAAVDAGLLREDLFYRLNVARLQIPCLSGDTEAIARKTLRFLGCLAKKHRKPVMKVSSSAMAVLQGADWPEDCHQLYAVLDQVVSAQNGAKLTVKMLPKAVFSNAPSATPGKPHLDTIAKPDRSQEFENAMETILHEGIQLLDLERAMIEHAISFYGGSIPQAAQKLGVAPSTIYRKKAGWDDN